MSKKEQLLMPDGITAEKIVPANPPGQLPGFDGAGPVHYVSFRLGRQLFALPLSHVERVLRMVAVTCMPESPAWVAGVIDLQGQVVPVVDLRSRFGQPAPESVVNNRLLIIRTPGQNTALAVDQANALLEVAASQVEQPTSRLASNQPVMAVIRQEDQELVLVLDMARLLPVEETN
jgi:purine-binding chemotaxis protein CheW